MNIDGVRIYDEGVEINQDCEVKIRKIVNDLRSVSPAPDIGMRFVKSGRSVEALLWGKASDISLGIYNRGTSLARVLTTLHRKVKKQYSKPAMHMAA